MFTVQDVLDAYRKHGVKPLKGDFGAIVCNGKITTDGACCPLTVLVLGEPVEQDEFDYDPAIRVTRAIRAKYPGFYFNNFWLAFDSPNWLKPSDDPATQLGRDVRRAIEELGWLVNPPVPDETTKET